MIQIRLPENRQIEAQWVCSIIFNDFLGLDYVAVPSLESGYCLSMNGKKIDLADVFFTGAADSWLKPESLALVQWNLSDVSGLDIEKITEPLPVLFGNPSIEFSENRVRCHVDIFGTAFYMLSRYEEVVKSARDDHDRFAAVSSLAYEANFLYRPIVDEYVEILWACIKFLWPQLERKPEKGHVFVTCDVDQPYDCGTRDLKNLARLLGSDLLNRYDVSLAARRVKNFVVRDCDNYFKDHFNTFDWYMEICEKHSRRAAFYFIADHPAGVIDGCYDLNEPYIQKLLHKISRRGHEIGMHASYNTYKNSSQIAKERLRLAMACKAANADDSVLGNRQHYLRWDTSQTPDYIDAAGFEYDSTGSFADAPGFRYGTSKSFNMWSWQKNAPLKIRQRPLILMDCSVIDDLYLGLGYTDEALDLMINLKEIALKFGANFSVLWHNSHLTTAKDREFFETLIK